MSDLFAKKGLAILAILLLTGGTVIVSSSPFSIRANEGDDQAQPNSAESDSSAKLEKATFGGGCFWCTEAVYRELKGVYSVVSGYSGGSTENPTYKEVSTGLTGHAEVIQVEYDPRQIQFVELLEVFWKTHDPTTLNRQGADVGPQYRSVVFYRNDAQRQVAEQYKKKLDESGAFSSPIVTEISPFKKFFSAEDYHQDYFQLNKRQPYCSMVIQPKLEKFRRVFKDKLK